MLFITYYQYAYFFLRLFVCLHFPVYCIIFIYIHMICIICMFCQRVITFICIIYILDYSFICIHIVSIIFFRGCKSASSPSPSLSQLIANFIHITLIYIHIP